MKAKHPAVNINVGHPYIAMHPMKEGHPMRGDFHPKDVHPVVPAHP